MLHFAQTDNISVLIINLEEILKSKQNSGHKFSFNFPRIIKGIEIKGMLGRNVSVNKKKSIYDKIHLPP